MRKMNNEYKTKVMKVRKLSRENLTAIDVIFSLRKIFKMFLSIHFRTWIDGPAVVYVNIFVRSISKIDDVVMVSDQKLKNSKNQIFLNIFLWNNFLNFRYRKKNISMSPIYTFFVWLLVFLYFLLVSVIFHKTFNKRFLIMWIQTLNLVSNFFWKIGWRLLKWTL